MQKFKTNINCGGCLAAVTPALDARVGKGNWNVDTGNPDKTLTVNGNSTAEEVISAVEKAGFIIKKL